MIIIIEKNATNIPLKINIPYTNLHFVDNDRKKIIIFHGEIYISNQILIHDLFLHKLGKDLKLLFDERKIFI